MGAHASETAEDALLPAGASASPLEERLLQQLKSGRTALPVLPHVATLALRLASDQDASIVELAHLVDGDPPIAARFLSVANSVAYYRGWAAASTQAAILVMEPGRCARPAGNEPAIPGGLGPRRPGL
jgi:hypothetical protein